MRLDRATLALAVTDLAARDRRLRLVVERHGPPPLWARPAGFTTLARIILEQQVSLASGRAAYARMVAAVGAATPERVAAVPIGTLRGAGLTRQKAAYIQALARTIADGSLDLRRVARASDDAAREMLDALPGIGRWSADIYLLMALRRADVWPAGDLALQIAAREVLHLRSVPDADALDRLAERWRPYRAVAARVLWHHYLSTPRVRVSPTKSQ